LIFFQGKKGSEPDKKKKTLDFVTLREFTGSIVSGVSFNTAALLNIINANIPIFWQNAFGFGFFAKKKKLTVT